MINDSAAGVTSFWKPGADSSVQCVIIPSLGHGQFYLEKVEVFSKFRNGSLKICFHYRLFSEEWDILNIF